jgi:NADPH-dependent 2,4-dienoyl-CoA reductase/sulfur reductase-like enzyme/predicted acylesterase/phospholipase RssA
MPLSEASVIDFLLIGGGLASATAAETLRVAGAEGRIAMLCGENTLPYHRPPLSKEFLIKGPDPAKALVHDEAFYRDRNIDVHLGTRVRLIDADNRTVETDDREHFRFSKLLIATGASVHKLSGRGADLAGIYYLRTVDDALSLYQAIARAQQAIVIGASFLGMEIAASLATRGIATTLLARERLVYDRLCSPEASSFFANYFKARGVSLMFGEEVEEFLGTTKVESVVTRSGKRMPCDLVAIGIGVQPEVGFLRDSGIDVNINEGILVNQHLETNKPGIYAAGDVANFYNPITRSNYRAEHWDNAIKQGRLAALNMLGERQSWRTVSYFFSDVFDLTFNVVGSTENADEQILRGSLRDRSFSVLYLDDERVRGAFLLEQSLVEAKAAGSLIANRSDISATKAKLSDSTFALNQAAVQTVLVLQGGGALGAFECGVVKALEEQEIHADFVAGVSIGAFNAAIIAANPGKATAALEAFWRDLSLNTPDIPNEELRRATSSLQTLVFGSPNFFRPRWFEPILSPAQVPTSWTSFYDPSPLKATLSKYVAFEKLRDSPVRLVLTAVDVETGQLTIFDSYVDEITPEHVLASGSLPPGFSWTTIDGRHYWDGGLVSNSPLDQVVEVGGLTWKNVFIVNLWPDKRALPRSIPEVLARRDEIVFAEKIRRNISVWEYIDNYRKLIEDVMASLDPKTAEQISKRPRYIETVGEACPMSVTRITREPVEGESASRDYEFSRRSIEHHIAQGYALTMKTLKSDGHLRPKAHVTPASGIGTSKPLRVTETRQ